MILIRSTINFASSLPVLYPIPSNGETVNLVIPNDQEVQSVIIYSKNGIGRNVHFTKVKDSQFKISLRGVSRGISFVRIITDKATYNKKIVIN